MTDPLNDLPEPGDLLLGKFRIERIIGQGGAGVVYAAYHELLHQRIALKLLLAEPSSEAAVRFLNEARLAAKIPSEHICRVMDVGTLASGLPYIAMEYLDGRDLDAVVATGALPIRDAVDYVLQAADAMALAHEQGVIHRDLKPANLFLAEVPGRDRPMIKVLDFGISKGDLGSDTNLTTSRAILGSPAYMSPEQIINARTVDRRTDVWSLGVILFELVTGQSPFRGETVGEVFSKILDAEPPPLRSILPGASEQLERVIQRCLTREREQRYANAAQLAAALRALNGGTPTIRPDEPTPPLPLRRGGLRLWIVGALVGVGALVYFKGPDHMPWLGNRGAANASDTDAAPTSNTFDGLLDALATSISSLGSDAAVDLAADDAGATPTVQKDAGRRAGNKPLTPSKTPRK